MTDRLAKIKAKACDPRGSLHFGPVQEDIDWLITEVERLRFELKHEEKMRERDFKEALSKREIRP